MNTQEPLAQALDACLEQTRAAGLDARAALAACPEGLLDGAEAAALAPILELALALDALPKAPSPSTVFRAHLAAELAAAPAPRSLARREAAAEGEGHSTSELVLALDEGLAVLRARSQRTRTGYVQRQVNGRTKQGRPEVNAPALRPELAGELDPLLDLAAMLDALPAIPGPNEAFQSRLAGELAAAPPPRSLPAQRAPVSLGLFRRLWRSTAFTAAAAATVVLFLVSGVAYASAGALPGQPLYPVKRASEQVQIWLAPDDAVELHLGLAGRRLHEALTASDQAGGLLADFSREVTAALVAADHRLAARAPRAEVAGPLLGWLLGARVDLVGGRPKLPPMAWRASLALVDEAIAALRSGETLAVAPVPRLGDPSRRLALAAPGEIARLRPAARLLAPIASDPAGASGSGPGQSDARVASRGAADSGRVPPPIAAAPAGPPPVDPAQVVLLPENPPPPSGSGSEDPDDPNDEPFATAAPDPQNLIPTSTPEATLDLPPTATLEPTSPAPTPTPTELPPVKKAPVITSVSCSPAKLPSNSEATCTVDAEHPERDAMTYKWSVNQLHGKVTPDDAREVKLLVGRPGSGFEPLELTIRITVTDSLGNATAGHTVVVVVPFLENAP